MKTIIFTAAVAAVLAGVGGAQAHVVLSQTEARPGAYYAGEFRVGHGCAGSATTALTVTIPAGIISAKPQPKAGWSLEILREPLAAPITGEGGQVIRERVKSITWRGRLPDAEFDAFGISAKLPNMAGPLYFPTVQTCEAGENRWTDIPGPGQAWHDVRHPAPVINIAPAPDMGMAMPGMEMHEH
ncbi:MAG: YcnI family protein [Caulobacteraceae bacterium]|nr:YcnI family protein [Caulobacteraceae bacterium]